MSCLCLDQLCRRPKLRNRIWANNELARLSNIKTVNSGIKNESVNQYVCTTEIRTKCQ